MAKTQHFKLGAKASSFTYPTGNITILPGQKVEISKDLQRHPFIADAIRGGHIQEVTSGDEKALVDVTSTDEDNKAFNVSKASKAQLVAQILTLEGNDEDEEDLSKRNKTELINIYNDLTEEDEEEEDEDEDEDA